MEAHETSRPDIWTARDVTLIAGQVLAPMAVGVWDDSVDLRAFPGRTFGLAEGTPGTRHELGV